MNAVEARGLSVRYEGRPEPALQGVSFALAEGELATLAGPSGAGKTTLLSTILGYIPEGIPAAVQGELSLFGEPAPPLSTRAGEVSLVQQDPEAQVCTLRVRDEVAFGPENFCLPREVIARRVEQALSTVGLEGLSERPTWTLSGGEKQRLNLASILALEPRLLLLDEPTAHLDPKASARLLSLVAHLHEDGRAILIAEHRLGPLLQLRPSFIWFSHGRLVGHWATLSPEKRSTLPLRGLSQALPRPDTPKDGVLIRVRGLRFAYPGGRELFPGLSFDLAPGEILGVIGENGTGKTSLLRLLAALARPVAGEILLAGEPIQARHQQRVGFVFQMPHHQLFASTVAQEIALGRLSPDGDEGAWLSLAGLETLAEEHPLRLSQGERRRLTLILALSRRPKLLLLDEPFIGQDQENMDWIAHSIVAAAQEGVGVVLVSHDIPAVAELSHRVLFLGEEPLLGRPTEIFRELSRRGYDEFTPSFWKAL